MAESSSSEDLPPAEATEILICSPPSGSSPDNTNQDEEFQTPEEQLIMASSDDLNKDLNVLQVIDSKTEAVVDSGTDFSASGAGTTVDLGRDTDLVFSDDRSMLDERHLSSSPKDVHIDVFVGENREASKISLSEKDGLGFSEPKERGLVPASADDDYMRNEEVYDFNDVVVGIDACVAKKQVDDIPGGESSSMAAKSSLNLQKTVADKGGNVGNVDNASELEKTLYIKSGVEADQGQRRIAADDKEANPPQTYVTTLQDLMNRTSSRKSNQNIGEDIGDSDVLEVAMKVGLKIPRPRWWRREGY